jgi:hypothetical protein|tara:strand:+ start:246 stop:632 length:387 start_codon:yes stop_codon:yes gene_type:complete
MNENDLGLIVEKNSARFNLLISDKVFPINKTRIFQAENPVTEPTTRGGVYVADLKERKIEAVFFDTDITDHLTKAMLGPNKSFLDIYLEAEIGDGKKIFLVTNLTNSMQNSSKVVLYLSIKDFKIKSD